MSNITLNNIDSNNSLVRVVLNFAHHESGSDYMSLLADSALTALNLGARHEVAAAAVAAMEEQDVREGFMLPSRKVASISDEGSWSYKIGWGGTEIEIHAEEDGVEVVVKSYYYDEDTRERVLKGSAIIFEDDRGVRAAWWVKEGDHSVARLKWLLVRLEDVFGENIAHTGHVERVRAFVPLAATNGW